MKIWRAVFAAVLATVLLSTGTTATANATATGAATTLGLVTRESANGCGFARFGYFYEPDGYGYYIVSVTNGLFNWDSSRSTCGAWGQPYAPLLQWKGEYHGSAFGWQLFASAPALGQHEFSYGGVAGFNNVRFRLCNWNTVTGTVGTCGSS